MGSEIEVNIAIKVRFYRKENNILWKKEKQ